jgi:GWxTD domain-containing protein
LRRGAARRGLAGALLAGALLLAGCGSSVAAAPQTAADLTNAQLSPAFSQWLVGAVSRLATAEEVRTYLALHDDAAAQAFIESFWAARDPDPSRPGNPLRELFEQREREADRRFSEAGYLGRRTDRGRTFVLYGEPKKVDHEINPRPGDPPLEVWTYEPASVRGLDRRPPLPVYRFVKRADLTVLFTVPLSQRGTVLEPEQQR